ncbi:hypothetical protein [Salegentibacter salarius]|uniref:DUF304 domain-containing protein n=1 Tax=Salegentibacter salarius TaxID=435906 RepID=A0A2N0TW16_9FLAO|nr:hypothetical protein [Salegentibacter salarius]OEY72636.1 hypothetical protein BHS39_12075 [Salegentibacter salarius]PKD18933.1 hypothetical protein APR40_12050 [Salegentibacter salarius]SLK01415.1 hypothetical protein SAMN05660445_02484 [Salegentibacter salarius]
MPQISKKVSFFRRNYFYITGGFWLGMGIALILVGGNDFIAYPYTIVGLIGAGYGYFKNDLPLEFIRWDNEKIEISEWQQSTRSYNWRNIDGINVSATNLTIKSGPAGGTMVELKGYSEVDIEKLKTELIPEQNLATA